MSVENINPDRHPILWDIAQGARWRDHKEYPSYPEWADLYERLLEFVKDKAELPRFLPRLRDHERPARKAFAEIEAGYFRETCCGLPVVGWEPPGANGKTGEYLVELPKRRQMFVEVKARGWEEEIILAEGEHSPRLRQPKYVDGEVRALAPWRSVRETVRKAYPKMPDITPTLLIINDDLFVALNDWPLTVKIALYCPRGAGDHRDTDYLAEDGCFVGSTYERLGAVGVLNVQLGAGGLSFRFMLFQNPNALPAVAIPVTAFPDCRIIEGREERYWP
jgi:hypothetical protein